MTTQTIALAHWVLRHPSIAVFADMEGEELKNAILFEFTQFVTVLETGGTDPRDIEHVEAVCKSFLDYVDVEEIKTAVKSALPSD